MPGKTSIRIQPPGARPGQPTARSCRALVGVVLDRHGAHRGVAVGVAGVLPVEVAGLHHAGDPVEVVHVVVVELAVRVVPQLVVRVDDGLVVVEHLERPCSGAPSSISSAGPMYSFSVHASSSTFTQTKPP